MRNISKQKEPRSLQEIRNKPGTNYKRDLNSNPAAKEELRASLLAEQGYLCCYCMSRVDEQTCRIEHWHCQTKYDGESLDYRNLLAACPGGQKQPYKLQHCDYRKGDDDLLYNPADPARDFDQLIRYMGDGIVSSSRADFDKELNDILNLNHPILKRNRELLIRNLYADLDRPKGTTRTKAELEDLLRDWQSRDAMGKLPEYCEVAVYHLKKRLKRA
ncbi:MAG TPA: retron system putative HNH endonuclease [bacterium]|jgi:uncharacterized protein (TIGR02646 family)